MPRKEPATNSTKRKKILLVDDHPLMRRGQADLLNREADFAVCGEAGTAREAMEAIAKVKPDLVLVDMALPDKDGLELIKDLQALHPELPGLVMSMHDESLYAERMLRAGANATVSPSQIGGLRMASELIRPHVVGFLDTMLKEQGRTLRVEEIEITPASAWAVAQNGAVRSCYRRPLRQWQSTWPPPSAGPTSPVPPPCAHTPRRRGGGASPGLGWASSASPQ
jgi:CheY-like chemotaxis protein